jgi:DNA-binding response OmpR family regulator
MIFNTAALLKAILFRYTIEHMRNEKILIVDDDHNFIEICRTYLSQAGFDISTANDGQQALSKILTNPPSLILLDIMMPILNGFELLERLQERPKLNEIPVIIMTNLDDSDEIKTAYNLGAKDYLIKANNNPEKVLKRIKNFL